MKPGARALGIAESYTGQRSTLAGSLVTAHGRVEDFVFGTCTVGGTDSTASIIDMVDRLDREDTRLVMLAGVALSWFNIVDIAAVAEAIDPPVVAVTFEESSGLEPAIREAFEGAALERRLQLYSGLPSRHPVDVNDHTMFVRSTEMSPERCREHVIHFTADNQARPEPLRVAQLAAYAVDRFDP